MFGFDELSPKRAVVRSQYVHDVAPARTLEFEAAAIRILFWP